MKKTWLDASVEELVIEKTENGMTTSDKFDGPWVQINGKNYRPGGDEETDSLS